MEAKTDWERVHIYIKGRVQGVSFRWWIFRGAQGLGLVGWVKNLEDGRVEILAEGEKTKLTKLIKLSKRGPFLASVTHLDLVWEKATREFSGFEITK